MAYSPGEPWPRVQQTATVLGLHPAALMPAVCLSRHPPDRMAGVQAGRWAGDRAGVDGPHGFPVAALAETLAPGRRRARGVDYVE